MISPAQSVNFAIISFYSSSLQQVLVATQVQANRVRKTYVIQLVKDYQNYHHMTLHDHPFEKNGGSKNSLFHFFDNLKR
jgi:hypothetical protein